MLLNFADRTRSGVFNMVWPLTRDRAILILHTLHKSMWAQVKLQTTNTSIGVAEWLTNLHALLPYMNVSINHSIYQPPNSFSFQVMNLQSFYLCISIYTVLSNPCIYPTGLLSQVTHIMCLSIQVKSRQLCCPSYLRCMYACISLLTYLKPFHTPLLPKQNTDWLIHLGRLSFHELILIIKNLWT